MLLFALECGWNARRFWSGLSNFHMISVLQLHVRPTFGVSHSWIETRAYRSLRLRLSGADFQSNKWCNCGSGSAQHWQNGASAGNSTSQSGGFFSFLGKYLQIVDNWSCFILQEIIFFCSTECSRNCFVDVWLSWKWAWLVAVQSRHRMVLVPGVRSLNVKNSQEVCFPYAEYEQLHFLEDKK